MDGLGLRPLVYPAELCLIPSLTGPALALGEEPHAKNLHSHGPPTLAWLG